MKVSRCNITVNLVGKVFNNLGLQSFGTLMEAVTEPLHAHNIGFKANENAKAMNGKMAILFANAIKETIVWGLA